MATGSEFTGWTSGWDSPTTPPRSASSSGCCGTPSCSSPEVAANQVKGEREPREIDQSQKRHDAPDLRPTSATGPRGEPDIPAGNAGAHDAHQTDQLNEANPGLDSDPRREVRDQRDHPTC